ncbi:prophage antirepressor-like protein [Pseudomonas nitritireducens]|uniref:Prophage antirepressor-like protein n=1 Tax=Pseudomonas nitroreducens TaxID=46680 RepID=A0A7W7KH53_PSENT|nr:BRO family protein [Pseudomonas nitritireducens]MBB4861978.1 prophage antirepressor-like protein [Pseudomonas nitritireducens]
MQETYTPTFFKRHHRTLRAVLIDQQPWFSAYDLARLLVVHYPQSFHHRFLAHEVRSVRLQYVSGKEEVIEMLSEAALYKALVRFGHPEVQTLDLWLTREVIPVLRDQVGEDSMHPRRVLMTWHSQRLTLLSWQGDLWMPWEDMPRLVAAHL